MCVNGLRGLRSGWLRPRPSWHNRRVPGGPYDPAIIAALTDTIVFELRAQLVDTGLDLHEIEGIAAMVADQVLTEWNVSPRPDSPTAQTR